MKSRRLKILSILLTLCMTVGMLQPAAVYAAETTDTGETVIAEEIDDSVDESSSGGGNDAETPVDAETPSETETPSDAKSPAVEEATGVSDVEAQIATASETTVTIDTYLSDLEWTEQSCGGKSDFPNGTAKNTNINGAPMQLVVDGTAQTFAKGLGIHAPSSVTYNIAGKGYMKFQSYAGVDYSRVNDYNNGEAVIGNFIVKIDGEVVAESGAMNPTQEAYFFAVTIPADAETITLETVIGDRQDWADWGDWADAKLVVELADPENLALNKNVAAKNTRDDSDANVNNDRPTAMAVDGVSNNSGSNYCDFGSDGDDTSRYLQIDLGKVCMLDKVKLYRYWLDGRTYDGTVIAISATSDFENATVIYNSDKDNVHGFGAGTDATYPETEEGLTVDAEYAQGRYLRLYMAGSDKGTTNHVCEIEAWGWEIESDPVPATGVEITATRISYEEGTTIKEGRKAYLSASVLPTDSTEDIVSWSSADESVATVEFDGDECVVTGVKAGEVAITATTTEGAEGTITINVLEKKEAAAPRRVVDADHILYLENYYWSDDFANKSGISGNVAQEDRVDSPVMLWETVPDSLKDNTVILLIAERSLNNTDAIKQWIKDNVELCNANNIPCAVQNLNGETDMSNPIPIEFYEELAQNNPYLVGFNGAELYNRFNGDAREYMVDLIQMGVENGVHMMWTDTNIFGEDGVLVDWLEECQDLSDVMRANKDYISLMYKESYGRPDTEALYIGLWLTDHIGNWGIASDWWHWQLDSNGALFDAGSGGDAWKQCLTWPEAMYTMDILRAASNGATCFKSEAQWYSNATKGMRTPAYQYTIAPFLEKLASGEYKIPSKEEVLADTKAIVVGRKNWTNFNYDTSYSQLYPATDKYGIVPFVPENCPAEELEQFENVFRTPITKDKMDEIYTTDVTGGTAYCENYGDTYYFMNSSEDKDVTQNAVINPATEGVSSVDITATPHTYGVITAEDNKITFSLGNYRIDKSEIWSSEAPGWFGDMECYQYVWEMCERMKDDTNHDKTLRDTVITVTCDEKPTAVFAADNEYTRHYEYTEDWNADKKTYTLTVKHNGIVDVDLITNKVAATTITVTPETADLKVGENVQLEAALNNGSTATVTWTSSDEAVATVNEYGKVYAKAEGKATITAEADGKKATAEITVTEVAVEKIVLSESALEIMEGKSASVTASVTPNNATDKSVTWTSSNEAVATVNGGKITAVKPGKTTITATTSNGLTAAVELTVTTDPNPSKEIPQSGIKATTDSAYGGTSEGPASNVLDGNMGTIWHSNYAPKDKLPVYIELDLGAEYSVNKIEYVPRSGGGNGTITKYNLYIDGELVIENGTWELSEDVKEITFDTPVKATKIKLEVLEGKGGFASAAEIRVYQLAGISSEISPDTAALAAKVDQAAALDLTKYEDGTAKEAFKSALTAAQAQAANPTDQFAVDKALATLEKAQAALVKIADTTEAEGDDQKKGEASGNSGSSGSKGSANKKDLKKAITKAEKLNESDYTWYSWDDLETALKKAKEVYDDKGATQGEVDKAVVLLNAAFSSLRTTSTLVEGSKPASTSPIATGDSANIVPMIALLGIAAVVFVGITYKKKKS